jgi:thioredoxin-related protein
MNQFPYIFATLFLLSFSGVSHAQGEVAPWHTRYAPAVAQAKNEKKSLVIVFTGSAWIDICKTFETDILQQPDFLTQVNPKYVLLKLEYPQDNRLPAELAKEYQLLKDAYRVRGYPTVIMTDAEGRPFGMNGYQPITPDQYAKVLLAMLKGREIRDNAAAKAETVTGLDKAKALIESIPDLPGTLGARYYRAAMEGVIAHDPKNQTGKVLAYKKQLADVDYSSQMQKLAIDVQYGKMIELTDAYIREQNLKGELLQKALLNKLDIQQKQQNTTGAVKTLLEVVAVDPNSHFGKNAQKMLDNLRAAKIEEELKP